MRTRRATSMGCPSRYRRRCVIASKVSATATTEFIAFLKRAVPSVRGDSSSRPNRFCGETGMATFGELSIRAGERREHLCAASRVRVDRTAFGLTELAVVVGDIEQRLMDLPDVVEKSDALFDVLHSCAERSVWLRRG